ILTLDGRVRVPAFYRFEGYRPTKTSGKIFTMEVYVSAGSGRKKTLIGDGDGQIDAGFKAIEKIVPYDMKLIDFELHSAQSGSAASGYAHSVISRNGWKVIGYGKHSDSITSAFCSFVDGANRIKYMQENIEKFRKK
ncbi:MAG: alpha-isopropylmalate synthase regulatory domain-containing protein, partial [archaeon]